MQASPTKMNENCFTILVILVKVYHAGLPGVTISALKPIIRRIIPIIKASLIFVIYRGTNIHATRVNIEKTINAKGDCKFIILAITTDISAQLADPIKVITAQVRLEIEAK
jgi:hypothetical protein